MKINRTRNAARNIVFGIMERIIALIFPFISRTVFIYCLGAEFLGLNGLFTSIISVLSLTELGIGSAMVYHMYQAIAIDDSATICALLNFYKKCYRIIGTVIFIIGVFISPWLKYLIKGDIPDGINIYILFYINILNVSLSYILFAYKQLVLTAFQRNDIFSKVNVLLCILQNVFQIIILLVFKNYYLYCLVFILITGTRNIVNAKYVDKMYPQYKAQGKLSNALLQDIHNKVSALFINRVGNVVANSVDSIVISAFLGLALSAIYNNYIYIITTLTGFLQIYYSSISAGVGNSISVENVDKNYHDFEKLIFIQYWIVGWSSICLLCLYQPFMEIWVGEKWMLSFGMVICLVFYFYFWKIQDIVYVYKEASGLWQQDKYCSIVATIFNLCLNVFLVQFVGLYGIVISTILMNIIIIIPWRTHVLYKNYFRKKACVYYKKLLEHFIIVFVVSVMTYGLCNLIKGHMYFRFIIIGIICLVFPNFCFWIIFRRMLIYKETKGFLKDKIKVLKKNNKE